jgi:beta-lactamase superfamily II metal-dependent hydrolase
MARTCLRVQHSFAWIPLWPDDFLFSSSMVLLLNYGQSSVLLEGDAERAVERRIAVPYHPNADLLRAV